MSVVEEVVSDAAIGIGVSDTPKGLSAIHHPGCAATIWRRDPMHRFQSWIDAVEPERLPRTRMILRPDAVREALAETCELAGTPSAPERDMLVDDTAALAAIFAEIMRAPYLRLRYDVVTTNACEKFHLDAVVARLICTYRGTGTQYGISTDGAEPQRVLTAPTGAPIILRGAHWPDGLRSGLLHRSPPIEGTGETRLVLVIDPITDPADEPNRGM
ncbi:MAG: DUF1826 domain-containing protein, partial [Pseudomonadota bacterium]